MSAPKVYRPELSPTRGELIAWGLAAVCVTTWGVIRWQTGSVPLGVTIFTLVFLLAALSIRLSNWMDRRTEIRLDEEAIEFRNGLRKTTVPWKEMTEVRIIPARWGQRVQVLGEMDHFEYRTLGEVKYQGEVRGRMGFAEGQEILDTILRRSDLERQVDEDEIRYYYRT